MNTRRVKLALDSATVLLVVAGVAYWFMYPELPARTLSGGPHRSAVAAGQPAQLSPVSSSDADAVVAGNIFSPTRAAPAARYTPNSQVSANAGENLSEPMIVPAAAPPLVYGTMTGPAGAMALIQPDSSGASGRLYREGERVGQFRIERILKRSVVMRGPSGRIEIPVEQREDRSQ